LLQHNDLTPAPNYMKPGRDQIGHQGLQTSGVRVQVCVCGYVYVYVCV